MHTLSLNRILFRWLISLSGVVLGVITAAVFLLWVGNSPQSVQAANSPLPLKHGPGVRTAVQESSIGTASLTSSPAQTLTGEIASSEFGYPVATAGDVNGDGYADVIVGAHRYDNFTGRAYVYLGSENGLSTMPAFIATGEAADSLFGVSVATAGDVNGDGFADIIVGASGYFSDTGRVYLYLGSKNGLITTPAFTATGEATQNYFGYPAITAGDVNGDGYSDVGIGAYQHLTYTGRIYIYAGSASGLSTTPIFTASGGAVNDQFGFSLATTGDVNGDGYSELLVGARGYNNSTGRACLYPGNGSYGVSLNPRQRRSDDTAPIAHGGQSDSATSFRLAALGRSPFGRGKVKLEWEVKPLGTPLDGTGTQQSAAWLDSGTAGAAFNELVTGLSANTVYHWRVRVRYHPANTPFQQYSRWFTQPWNGWQEADLRTAAGPTPPPIKLYLPFIAR